MERVAALHAESDYSTREIAERAGLSYRTTQEFLSRLGLKAHRPERWDEGELTMIERLHRDGMTDREIGARLGVPAYVIESTRHHHGIRR